MKLLQYHNDVAFEKDQRRLEEKYKGYSQSLKEASYDHHQDQKTQRTLILHFL